MSSTPTPPTHTREQQIAALTKATAASLQPDNQNKLHEDVNNLVQKLKDARSGFSAAGIALDKVDKADRPDGKALNDTGKSFFNQWNAISKQFDDLLTQSCEVAGNVAGQCMFFENGVLKFVAEKSENTAELIGLVKTFVKGLKDDQGKIAGFSSQFIALSSSVEQFANNLNVWATKTLNTDEQTIKDLQDAVRNAQKNIDQVSLQIAGVAVGMVLTLVAIVVLWILFPSFGDALAGVALPTEIALMEKYAKEIKTDKAKIDSDNKKIADLSEKIELVKEAQSEMNTVSSTKIHSIVASLKGFQTIWDTATGDAAFIQGYLENLGSSESDMKPVILVSYIQLQSSLYKSFGNAMLNYAKLQTSALVESGVNYEPRPVEERLWSLVELGKIYPLVNEVVQDILKNADLRVRV